MANEVRLIDMNTLWQCDTCFHSGPCGCKEWCDAGETYRPAADKLKIIDPESLRPKGRWTAINADCRGYANAFECSNCETVSHTHTYTRECDFDYCPNCGAKMMEG